MNLIYLNIVSVAAYIKVRFPKEELL